MSKLIRTGTDVAPIYERIIYIDGIFEPAKRLANTPKNKQMNEQYHKLENGTTYEKNYVQIMDDKSRICEVRVGTPFPDDIADATTYILEDQIGSSVARLDTSGAFIDIEEYYPFGDSSLRTFSRKRYRYVGKEKDLESGLYYYGARYYAAWTCRFISVDPLAGKYAQLSPYNYADNNPINDFDIDGQQATNTNQSLGSEVNSTNVADKTNVASNIPKNADNLKPVESNVYQINKVTGAAEKIDISGLDLSKADQAKLERAESLSIEIIG